MLKREEMTSALASYDTREAERKTAADLVKKALGRRIYVVRWTSDGQKCSRIFFAAGGRPDRGRQRAILFLNYLILDCSYTDAKLRTERTV